MSKSIKVTEQTYERLCQHQRPRETFSDEVDRLLELYEVVQDVKTTLGPSHYLMEKPAAAERK